MEMKLEDVVKVEELLSLMEANQKYDPSSWMIRVRLSWLEKMGTLQVLFVMLSLTEWVILIFIEKTGGTL